MSKSDDEVLREHQHCEEIKVKLCGILLPKPKVI